MLRQYFEDVNENRHEHLHISLLHYVWQESVYGLVNYLVQFNLSKATCQNTRILMLLSCFNDLCSYTIYLCLKKFLCCSLYANRFRLGRWYSGQWTLVLLFLKSESLPQILDVWILSHNDAFFICSEVFEEDQIKEECVMHNTKETQVAKYCGQFGQSDI